MISWYHRPRMRQLLVRWMQTLVSLYPGTLVPSLILQPKLRHPALFNFARRTAYVNPLAYGHDSATQYRASKALVTHEVAHHLFTPHRSDVSAFVHQVHNILE